MEKRNFKKLVMLGLASGSLIANQIEATDTTKTDTKSKDKNDENVGYHLYTEDELMLELNPEGIKLYQALTPEGKKLALTVASARCNGTNECKGLNGCQTPANSCAGKGACKGQGKCAIADKNLAVKLVSQKMAAKREGLQK